jgi:hypothetical protein
MDGGLWCVSLDDLQDWIAGLWIHNTESESVELKKVLGLSCDTTQATEVRSEGDLQHGGQNSQ